MKEIFLHFSGYEGPKQRGPAEVGLVEDGATEIGFAEVGIDEVSFAEIGPTESEREIGL